MTSAIPSVASSWQPDSKTVLPSSPASNDSTVCMALEDLLCEPSLIRDGVVCRKCGDSVVSHQPEDPRGREWDWLDVKDFRHRLPFSFHGGEFAVLQQSLGKGYHAKVFEAVHTPSGRALAIKFPKQRSELPELRREFRVMEAIKAHEKPGDAPMMQCLWFGTVGRARRQHAMVLPRLGPDLLVLQDRLDPFPLPTSLVYSIGAGLVTQLQRLHAAGYVHMSMKPENVCLTDPKLFPDLHAMRGLEEADIVLSSAVTLSELDAARDSASSDFDSDSDSDSSLSHFGVTSDTDAEPPSPAHSDSNSARSPSTGSVPGWPPSPSPSLRSSGLGFKRICNRISDSADFRGGKRQKSSSSSSIAAPTVTPPSFSQFPAVLIDFGGSHAYDSDYKWTPFDPLWTENDMLRCDFRKSSRTYLFLSRAVIYGQHYTPCDDLESLAYVLLELLRGARHELPFDNESSALLKRSLPLDQLFCDADERVFEPLVRYMTRLQSVTHATPEDYAALAAILHEASLSSSGSPFSPNSSSGSCA